MKIPNHACEIQTRTWQMSFNDLLTVLLTFFILLVAVSDINVNKVQDVSSSATDVFGMKKYEDQQSLLIQGNQCRGWNQCSSCKGWSINRTC